MTIHRPIGWLTVARVPIPLPCRHPVAPRPDLDEPFDRCGVYGDLRIGASAGPGKPAVASSSTLCTRHFCDLIGDDADDIIAELDVLPMMTVLEIAGLEEVA